VYTPFFLRAVLGLRLSGGTKHNALQYAVVVNSAYFMLIALTRREEVSKLLVWHEEHVWNLHAEMEAVAELVVPAVQREEAVEDEENKDFNGPSILSVLNKDSTLILYIIFIFAPLCV
jgi:hypothetical protein